MILGRVPHCKVSHSTLVPKANLFKILFLLKFVWFVLLYDLYFFQKKNTVYKEQ